MGACDWICSIVEAEAEAASKFEASLGHRDQARLKEKTKTRTANPKKSLFHHLLLVCANSVRMAKGTTPKVLNKVHGTPYIYSKLFHFLPTG